MPIWPDVLDGLYRSGLLGATRSGLWLVCSPPCGSRTLSATERFPGEAAHIKGSWVLRRHVLYKQDELVVLHLVKLLPGLFVGHDLDMPAGKKVDHFSDELLSVQLASILREMITSGKLKQHESLPSETALMDEHEVSRGTVRAALKMLRDEGLIIVQHGRRSIVR